MIIGIYLLAIAVFTLEYVVWKYKKHTEYLNAALSVCRKDHNKLLCNVSRLLSRSRVALDGRLIVPRKVYNNFMEQSFDNDEVDYE